MPLLTEPIVVRCARCRVVLRDERSRPGVAYRTRLDECAACRVERGRPEDVFGPAAQDEALPCEASECCAAELRP